MSEPVPQRIGDAERDRAAEYLREHMSVGRLTQEEFDDRLTTALQARTVADLEPLFADLPAPKPGQESTPDGSTAWPVYRPPTNRPVVASTSAPTPTPMPSSAMPNVLAAASGIAWILFVLSFVAGFGVWWLVFVPIALSSIAGKQRQELNRREQLWQQAQKRQLPPGSEPGQASS